MYAITNKPLKKITSCVTTANAVKYVVSQTQTLLPYFGKQQLIYIYESDDVKLIIHLYGKYMLTICRSPERTTTYLEYRAVRVHEWSAWCRWTQGPFARARDHTTDAGLRRRRPSGNEHIPGCQHRKGTTKWLLLIFIICLRTKEYI